MYYLCTNHRVLQLLVQEIRAHFTNDADITFDNTPKLPYLAVVMQESFRMYPPFATALARTPPRGGEMVDGYFIPEKVNAARPS
jgi:cytochrome P450